MEQGSVRLWDRTSHTDQKKGQCEPRNRSASSLGWKCGRRNYLCNYQVPETIISVLVSSNLNHRAIHEVASATAQVGTLIALHVKQHDQGLSQS